MILLWQQAPELHCANSLGNLKSWRNLRARATGPAPTRPGRRQVAALGLLCGVISARRVIERLRRRPSPGARAAPRASPSYT